MQIPENLLTDPNWYVVFFTGVLAFIAFLQLIVFGLQARRLRQSVEASTEQSTNMKHSVIEAARSAAAMEEVAKHIQVSSKAATESVAAVKDRTAQQMRAYLSVLIGGAIYQERDKDLRFEVRPTLLNSGHTPARKVSYTAVADILPIPLPDDFAFPLPEHNETQTATLGSGQNFILHGIVDRFVDDADVEAVKLGAEQRVYVWGRVTYADVFEVPHFANFCYSVYWIPTSQGDMIGGHFTDRHNDAD